MRDPLLIEIVLFFASISPCGPQFAKLADVEIPGSHVPIVKIADLSQVNQKSNADFLAVSQLLAKHNSGESLEAADLQALPKTSIACADLVGATYAAAYGKKDDLAKLIAAEAKSRLVALPIEKDSDALIVRELSHLMSQYYESVGDKDSQQEMIRLNVQITLTRFTTSPHLVGASIVQYADFLNSLKEEGEKSADFYQKVVLDLGYLSDNPSGFPHAEVYAALYWLKRSRLAIHEITGDEKAKAEADKVDGLLKKMKVTEETEYVKPRFGYLAHLYCDEPHFIAVAIKHAELSGRSIENDDAVRYLGHVFGCSTADVEYYQLGYETKHNKEILDAVGIGKRTLNGRDDKDITEAVKILDGLKK